MLSGANARVLLDVVVCTRMLFGMLLVCTRIYPYVTCMYSCGVLVTIDYGLRKTEKYWLLCQAAIFVRPDSQANQLTMA